MDLQLKGKTVLITGSSKGIGLGVARVLAEEGCTLHLASRTEADLAEAKASIEAAHDVQVNIHPTDLSRRGAPEALSAACPDVDILINNAGAIPGGTLENVDEDTWRAAWDLKVFGYINLTRAFFTRMRERGEGTIVNVIGSAGERPDPTYIAGSMGNASLMAFTRGLGSTSLDMGVRVVAVNPGPVETDRIIKLFRSRAQDELGDPERYHEFFKKGPQGRVATVEEVADVVAFLASPRASYVCGTVITIDGGLASRKS